MPSFVLSTCGTSALTNGVTPELRKLLNQYANAAKWADIPEAEAQQLQAHCKSCEQTLLQVGAPEAKKISAELNGLLSWQARAKPAPQDDYYLLATDTVLGQEAAKIVQSWLAKQGMQAQILQVADLRTAQLDEFRVALSGLAKILIETVNGYKDKGYTVHFNLTGGFKGLNAYLQALSTIYADETFYLFESSPELLFIPRLPFHLDVAQTLQQNWTAFRRMGHGLRTSAAQASGIADALLFQMDGEAALSEWGTLIWEGGYKALYEEKLWPSISERVIFEDGFENSTKGLTPQRLEKINAAIAELGKWAESGFPSALRSLDPKPLTRGDFKGKDIWECDTDDWYRIYFHKKGDYIRLQKVDKALH